MTKRHPIAPGGTLVMVSGPSRAQLIRWARAGYRAAIERDAPRVAAICSALLRAYGEPDRPALPAPPGPATEWSPEETRRTFTPDLIARTFTPDDAELEHWQEIPTVVRPGSEER